MRVVMLTPDIDIDRRIILEAKSLLKTGYEVIIISGWREGQDEYEVYEGIKIRRIVYNGLDGRLMTVYWLQSKVIAGLNILSRGNLKLIEVIALIIGFFHTLTAKFVNLLYALGMKFVNLLALLNNKIVGLAARAVNKFFSLIPKVARIVTGYSGYEYLFYKAAQTYDGDIYQAHDLPVLEATYCAAKKHNAPVVYDSHELYPEIMALTKVQKKYLRRKEKKIIRRINAVITVNEFIAEEMAKNYSIKIPNVIYNATSLNLNKPTNLLRQELNVPSDILIVLYQGWISKERSLDNLVEAGLYVPDNVCIVLMGYGDYRKELEALVEKKHIGKKVLFKDAVHPEVLIDYTSSADVGIIPYQAVDLNHYYCSPNKLFEFIQAGIPIIAEDLPFLRKIIVNEGIGIVSKLTTPKLIASSITEIFRDRDRFYKYKESIVEAKKKFNWDEEETKLISIFNDVEREIS